MVLTAKLSVSLPVDNYLPPLRSGENQDRQTERQTTNR